MILFALQPAEPFPAAPGALVVHLQRSSWDDYGFGTTFAVSVWSGTEYKAIGVTKIGRRGMTSSGAYGPETVGTPLDEFFQELDTSYVSVGQDINFYYNLVHQCGYDSALQVLRSLRDLSVIDDDLDALIDETVVRRSLLRSVSLPTIQDQYRRFLESGRALHAFSLTYVLDTETPDSPSIEFKVDPSRSLSNNVQVIIGANGVGKTTLLRNLRWAFDDSDANKYSPQRCRLSENDRLSALVSVSFSAFDVFEPEDRSESAQAKFRVTNVRLPWLAGLGDGRSGTAVADQQDKAFGDLIRDCLSDRAERLLKAFGLLAEADLILAGHGIDQEELLPKLIFSELSSGHKIVLLAIANIVRFCDEKTLVLVDEPESHLHPPLLGAFTSALSYIMEETNGLAIVATHSPVVLQEVTADCAWCLWNYDGVVGARNPSVQTLGENVGLLTREVFGLEIAQSGYHKKISEIAARAESYEEAVGKYGGFLGDEAKLILRSIMLGAKGR
ncbi:AAA family ATPase [Curtobacterium sp. L3-7]|uniref:AAA family ATPase n=1 Tax=Curtobacterium sp. L3-7 TaxID=3138787 RepID=UPI003B52F35B